MYMGPSVVTLPFKRVRIERQNASSFSKENELVILAACSSGEKSALVCRSGVTTYAELD